MAKTVLVADDDLIITEFITYALEYEGYHIVVVHNGCEALTYLRDKRADLLLSDIDMPVLNGWELVRSLSGQCPPQKMPIILMSGTSLPEKLTDLPAVGFLRKPFTLAHLLATVAQHFVA